ncbi:MAG: hypothetical protein R2911_00560 [Caldilineaceae bacterium]
MLTGTSFGPAQLSAQHTPPSVWWTFLAPPTSTPKLNGLFGDNNVPTFTSTHQVYDDWNWGCGGAGCRGDLLVKQTCSIGMATSLGEDSSPPASRKSLAAAMWQRCSMPNRHG